MKVMLIAAMTADGRIAKSSGHYADWTPAEDKEYFAKLSREHGAVIMGRKTFDTMGKPLPDRLNVIMTRDPDRKNDNIEDLLEFTDLPPEELVASLKKRGFESVVLAGGAQTNAAFLKKGLVDEMHVTIAPKIFGCGPALFADCDIETDLELVSSEPLGQDSILLKYRIK